MDLVCSCLIAPDEAYLIGLHNGTVVAAIWVISCDPVILGCTVALRGKHPAFDGTPVDLQYDTSKRVGPLTLKVIADHDAQGTHTLRLFVEGAETIIQKTDEVALAETSTDTLPVLPTVLAHPAAIIEPPEDLLQTAVWRTHPKTDS